MCHRINNLLLYSLGKILFSCFNSINDYSSVSNIKNEIYYDIYEESMLYEVIEAILWTDVVKSIEMAQRSEKMENHSKSLKIAGI